MCSCVLDQSCLARYTVPGRILWTHTLQDVPIASEPLRLSWNFSLHIDLALKKYAKQASIEVQVRSLNRDTWVRQWTKLQNLGVGWGDSSTENALLNADFFTPKNMLSNADFLTPKEVAEGKELNPKKDECLENFDYAHLSLTFDFQTLY